MTPLLAVLTQGRYYLKQTADGIAEPRFDVDGNPAAGDYTCHVCHQVFERPDVARCAIHSEVNCSLCLTTDRHRDADGQGSSSRYFPAASGKPLRGGGGRRRHVTPCHPAGVSFRDNGIGFEDRSTAVASLQEAVNEVTGEEGIWCSNPDGG